MLKIAITGNIASGKSTVENIFKSLGYKVLDADTVGHKVLAGSIQLKEAFKDFDVFENNEISRSKLSKLVFSNDNLRDKLNEITHPLIKNQIDNFFTENTLEELVFVSIPLLFEAKMESVFDKIILVLADDDTRLKRLIDRNNYTKKEALLRMSSQMPQAEKIEKSDIIISNNDDFGALKLQVLTILEQIL